MPTLSVKLDLRSVERCFTDAQHRARSLGQAFRILRADMRQDQREHADRQAGPDGAWPKLAASTLEHKRGKGRRRLSRRMLGRLVTTEKFTATSSQLIGESPVKWSGAQQEGDKVGRGARLPARTFMWISDRFVDKVITVLQRIVAAPFGGG